jgi:hypothetical protein
MGLIVVAAKNPHQENTKEGRVVWLHLAQSDYPWESLCQRFTLEKDITNTISRDTWKEEGCSNCMSRALLPLSQIDHERYYELRTR